MAFGRALTEAWSGDDGLMRSVLAPRASVTTPIWTCADAAEYLRELKSALDFLNNDGRMPPTLIVLSVKSSQPGVQVVQWMLGLEWPSVWRSKVNILGESRLVLSADGAAIASVTEKWHQTPFQIFLEQISPRFRDFISLWNSPTAENVPLRVDASNKEYSVVTLPAMTAVQAEWVETQQLLQVEQAPLPPQFAFTGLVKRSEWYSTVAPAMLERCRTTVRLPGGMQQVGQRRRWIMPLPMRYANRSIANLPDPDGGVADDPLPTDVISQSVQYVRRPAMRMAVRSIQGAPSNKNVIAAAREIAAAATADGLRVVRQDGQPVFVQLSYDAKIGFNSRAQIAMAVWLSVPRLVQQNKVGVLLDEPCEPEMLGAGGGVSKRG
jgi:hypothetical protein